MSGSRTGTGGCGSESGGKGIGPGFGFSGSDGSCGDTGGISGFSVESESRRVEKLLEKLLAKWFPLVRIDYSGRVAVSFGRVTATGLTSRVLVGVRSRPSTISSRVMILGSVI